MSQARRAPVAVMGPPRANPFGYRGPFPPPTDKPRHGAGQHRSPQLRRVGHRALVAEVEMIERRLVTLEVVVSRFVSGNFLWGCWGLRRR